MRKLFPILLMCFGVSGAFAQTDRGGVTVSNDPAKVAAVERHADELKARAAQQQAQGAAKTPAKAKGASTAAKPKSKTKKTSASKSSTSSTAKM